MGTLKFVKQKAFEKLSTFEKRLQEETTGGWKIHSFASDHGLLTVLMVRDR